MNNNIQILKQSDLILIQKLYNIFNNKMNTSNDKKKWQDRSGTEAATIKLKQIRSRVFGQENQFASFGLPIKKLNHKNSLNDKAKQTITLRVGESNNESYQLKANFDLRQKQQNENNYQNRIKNINNLSEKIKGLLGNGHKGKQKENEEKYHSNSNKIQQKKIQLKNNPKCHQYSYLKKRQSCQLKQQIINPQRENLKQKSNTPIKRQALNEKINIENQQNYQDIEEKLRQLRQNRAMIKKQLGINEKKVNQSFQIKQKQSAKYFNQQSHKKKPQLEFNKTSGLFYKQELNKKITKIDNLDQKFGKKNAKIDNLDQIKQVESIQIKNRIEQVEVREMVKLSELLGQQIIEDQKMRQYRSCFMLIKGQQKWNKLQNYLKSRNLNKEIDELKDQLTMSSQQHNPFDEVRITENQDQCIKKLAEIYEKSTIFWQTKLMYSISIKKLQNEYFTIRDIDLNKKGYLSIEDIVCFVNLYSGNFFRNRDIVLMYKRFLNGKNDHLSYEDFLSVLTKD